MGGGRLLSLCLAALGLVCSGLPDPWWLLQSPTFVCYRTDGLESQDHLCYLEQGGKKLGEWPGVRTGKGLELGSRGPGPFLPACLAIMTRTGAQPFLLLAHGVPVGLLF